MSLDWFCHRSFFVLKRDFPILMESENLFQGRFVKELTPKYFDSKVSWKLKSASCAMVLFYCPWCPHCKAMKEVWEKLGQMATFIDVQAFNCEKHKGHILKIQEELPELVRGYPTIVIYKDHIPVEEYRGDRSLQSLLKTSMRVCNGGRA